MPAPNPGLLAILEAKPGKEAALAEFLNTSLALAAREPGTRSWYAFRITATSFGIYDTFHDDDARQTHLSGPLARALEGIAGELLARAPEVREVDVLASKP